MLIVPCENIGERGKWLSEQVQQVDKPTVNRSVLGFDALLHFRGLSQKAIYLHSFELLSRRTKSCLDGGPTISEILGDAK